MSEQHQAYDAAQPVRPEDGEWTVTGPNGYLNQIGIGIRRNRNERQYTIPVAVVYGAREQAEPIARLMAAAPELLALARQYASECGDCNGTGLVTITTWPGGIEVDNDDQPCPDCADIRAVIAKATQVQP